MEIVYTQAIARTIARFHKFITRFGRDVRGNTLVIVGIAMIPLSAMIGSGVDMSRGYMAQARMQQACDAGALAGRRAMTGGTVDQTVKDEATKFFKFNFKTGTNDVAGTAAYGAKGFTPVVSAASDNATTVVITASTTIPTTVMKMFGYTDMPLSVTCNAKQDFVNTDVVLVLDTTGSMLCATTETSCSNTAEKTTSKIIALRAAVLALYDALSVPQTKLEAAGLRLRYGIVPYSSGVNIGKQLREMSTSYVVSDNWTYQSRRRVLSNYTNSSSTGNWASYTSVVSPWVTTTHTANDSTTSTQCDTLLATAVPSPGTTVGATTDVSTGTTTDANGVIVTTTVQQRITTIIENQRTFGVNDTSGNKRDCRIQTRTTTNTDRRDNTQTQTPNYSWVYEPRSYPVDQFVQGNIATTMTGSGFTNVNSTWKGCIEERDTVTTITPSSTSFPTTATDLDINLIPTDNATRWRPYWPEVVYRPDNGNQPQVACPSEARRLQAWTKANLSTYLNTLVADGGTYHDNGMRWGARLISSGGVFGPDNPTTFGNMPVSKTIIFMTDGIIDTGDTIYSTYGMERWDKRVTGGWTSDADQTGRHDARFKMMCSTTKGMGVSIWVVAFASALTSSLQGCATNDNQALVALTAAELKTRFEKIGNEIGALRLTQ